MQIGLGLGICRGGSLESGPSPFILEVDTTNAGVTTSTQMTLPLRTGDTYDFNVDWGDGNNQDVTSDSNIVHTYSSSGVYDITVTPQDDGTGFPSIYFAGANDDTKVTKVKQWGITKWDNFSSSFTGCSNMVNESTDEPDCALVTSFFNAFYSCSSLAKGISPSDVSLVKSTQGMYRFADLGTSTSIAMSFPACTTARQMFRDSYGSFNVGDLTFGNTGFNDNYEMFRNSELATMGDLDCSGSTSVVSISNTFRDCPNITTIGDVTYNGSYDHTATSFCYDNPSLTTIGQVSMAGTTNFQGAFRFNELLTSINLVCDSATNFTDIFDEGNALSSITLSDTSNVTNWSRAFEDTAITAPPSCDYSNGTIFTGTFSLCSSVTAWGNLDFSSATSMNSTFSGANTTASWGTITTSASLTSMVSTFQSTGFATPPTITNTSAVTNWHSCFESSAITSTQAYDTSAGATMDEMYRNVDFADTYDLPTHDLSAMTSGVNFLYLSVISTSSYDDLLVDMEANNSNTVTFHGGSSTYTATGETARDALIADHSWAFTDGGLEP